MNNPFPNTLDGIHLYASRYDSLVVPESYNEQLPKFDLMTGPFPNMDVPAGDPNTVELAHQANPDIVSMMYLHMTGEPASGAGRALPWGIDPDLSRIPHWEQANKYEGIFLHASEPSGLVALPGDGRIELSWMPDRRTVIPGWSILGYNVYRDGTLLNVDPIPGTSYIDQGLTNGQQYEYIVGSVIASGEIDYSWPLSAIPVSLLEEIVLYAPSLEIDPNESADGFHPIPGSTASYTIRIKCVGCPPLVICNFDGEDYEMTEVGNYYEIVVPDKATPASFWGGFKFHFESGAIRFPAEGSFTTNINNRTRNRWWGTYLTDPREEMLRQLHAQWITDWMATYGYDGVFYDLASVIGVATDGADAYPLDYILDQAEFSSTFIVAKQETLRYVKQQITPGVLMFNGPDNQGNWDGDYGGIADGAMIENFAYRMGNQFQPESVWGEQVQFVIDADRKYGQASICLSKRLDEGPQHIAARVYCLASYLLAKGRKTYFGMWPIGTFFTVPEYFVDIGEPVELMCAVGDFYDADLKIYHREYTRGLVFVNPSETETSEAVELGRTYYEVAPAEQRTENGGAINCVPVSSIQLAPNTGAILLNEDCL